MSFPFGPRRAIWTTIDPQKARSESRLTDEERSALEEFDEIYRTLADKTRAIVKLIEECRARQQPMLVIGVLEYFAVNLRPTKPAACQQPTPTR